MPPACRLGVTVLRCVLIRFGTLAGMLRMATMVHGRLPPVQQRGLQRWRAPDFWKAPAQGAAIAAAGDMSCQLVLAGTKWEDLDTRRTAAFAIFGFCYSGLFLRGCAPPGRRIAESSLTQQRAS